MRLVVGLDDDLALGSAVEPPSVGFKEALRLMRDAPVSGERAYVPKRSPPAVPGDAYLWEVLGRTRRSHTESAWREH